MGKTRTRYQPQRFRHRPTVVEGILNVGSVDCAKAIVDWGQERTGKKPFVIEDDELIAVTRQGRRYVPVEDTALLGVALEPYSIDREVREAAYVTLGVDYSAVPLTLGRVRELAAEADRTADRDRLRSIIAELASFGEALLA